MKMKIVNCNIADSKPVKQEVNGTVILPLGWGLLYLVALCCAPTLNVVMLSVVMVNVVASLVEPVLTF
jgi:hypothetical protein